MATTTYTSRLRLARPTTGELSGTWGTTVNTAITDLTDVAIAGFTQIALADANYTLSTANGAADEARYMMIEFTGALTAARNVVVPSAGKLYFIKNSTTGGFALTVKTAAGAGIAIPMGRAKGLSCNAVNVVEADTAVTDALSDLANTASATKGAGLVGYSSSQAYGANTVGAKLNTMFGTASSTVAYTHETQTASAGQTLFTLVNGVYTIGGYAMAVYRNGVRLEITNDYTETSTSTVTLTAGAAANDRLTFVYSPEVAAGTMPATAVTYTRAATAATAMTAQTYFQAHSINVKEFGATGDGTTDDYAAINAAYTALGSRGGVLFFPYGVYNLGTTLTIGKVGVSLIGEGSGGHVAVDGVVQLQATHSTGPVVRVQYGNFYMADMTLTSNGARYAGAAGSNHGLWIESPDSGPGLSFNRAMLERVRITTQPHSGLVIASGVTQVDVIQLTSDHHKYHGVVIDNGKFTARTLANRVRPGIITLHSPQISRNGGYATLVGDDTAAPTTISNLPYRVVFYQMDAFYNCQTPANVTYLYEHFFTGENCTIENSAIGGRSEAGTDDNAGIWTYGSHNRFVNNRYIDCNPYIARVEDHTGTNVPTHEITFEGGYIISTVRAAGFYNPAILVNTAATNVRASMHPQSTDVTTLMATTSVTPEVKFRTGYHWGGDLTVGDDLLVVDDAAVGGDFSVTGGMAVTGNTVLSGSLDVAGHNVTDAQVANNRVRGTFRTTVDEINLDDDHACYIQFADITRGVAVISGNILLTGAAIVHFRCGDVSAHATIMAEAGTVSGTTGPLAGTTGVDGELTVSADTATNRLYIENRTGSTRGLMVTFLSLNVLGEYQGYTAL